MTDRLRAVQRLLGVRNQLKRVAEWKLAGLNGQVSALGEAQREVIGALNAGHDLHGLFVGAMARHLGVLGKRSEEASAAAARQAQELRERTGQAKCAERLARKVELDGRREQEKAVLGEVIDQLARPGGASLP